MLPRADLFVDVAILLIGIAIGLGIGHLIWAGQTMQVAETPAMPIHHDDGSVTIIRTPGVKPRLPAPTTPKGTTTRVAEVELKPDSVHLPERKVGDVTCPPEVVECPTISLRLDTTLLADGTHRVSAVAKGGEILDAVDIPFTPSTVLINRPWALGWERTPDGRNGVAIERDIGRLRLGGTVTVQDTPEVGFRVLLRF